MLNVGDQAVDFSIKNQADETIRLKDFEGKKVVLYFYPKDNTPGCTTEACGLRDVYDEILDLGAVVLGVSKDSAASHGKFKDQYNLPFHLLADTDMEVIKAYGAWAEKKMYGKSFMGIQRMTYLIDENGKIKNIWPKVSPNTHADEVLKALKA